MRKAASVETGGLLSIALLLLSFAWVDETQAQGQRSGSLEASLQINAFTDVSFPEGAEFEISLQNNDSPWDATIQAVRMPFVVRGNLSATVSVQANLFRLTPKGFFYGKVLSRYGGVEALAYDIIVQFPISSPEFSGLPEREGPVAGTAEFPALPAIIVPDNNTAFGTIHLVPRHDWTLDDHNAKAGIYRGRINVTVATDRR